MLSFKPGSCTTLETSIALTGLVQDRPRVRCARAPIAYAVSWLINRSRSKFDGVNRLPAALVT